MLLAWSVSGKEELYTVTADYAMVRSNVEGKFTYVA